ncbi:hypothetical protein H0H93_007883 [Arthromyces matolae]|nr:hypothetical protein H0H93_007883 [Arthromyces matolae]
MKPVQFCLPLLLTAISSFGVVYDNFDSLSTIDYDFIVVGGGTAGNVIANRLTENPTWKVLVIEAGPSNKNVLQTIVPLLQPTLIGSRYDWKYTTIPQTALGGKVLEYTRGRILGGSSSISAFHSLLIVRWAEMKLNKDGMYYTRGSSSDFNRYAQVTGDPAWSWENLQPYIKKNERWTAPVDNHNTSGEFNPTVHGFDGINAVSLVGYPENIDPRFIQTTKDLPDEFPFNLDYNSGNPLGLSYAQQTIDKGRRSSSATSYLAPQFLNRSNLDVLLNSQVTRIVNNGTSKGLPLFTAVEVGRYNTELRKQFTASKEIVLSAGVIGTPQLLLLSGIGDPTELDAVGINAVVQLSDVGKNFADQPGLALQWLEPSTPATIFTTMGDQRSEGKKGGHERKPYPAASFFITENGCDDSKANRDVKAYDRFSGDARHPLEEYYHMSLHQASTVEYAESDIVHRVGGKVSPH